MHGVCLQTRASFLLQWTIFQLMLILIVCHGSATAEPKANKISYWYSHDYPNPRTEPERCGRPLDHESWICDPDNFISEADAKKLDDLIHSIYTETRCNCYPCITNSHGYQIMVALMEAMYRDTTNGTQSSLKTEASNFATELMNQWGKRHDCKENVLILYSRSDGVLYTKRMEQAKLLLNDTMVEKVNSLVVRYFSYKEGVTKGLTKMVNYHKDIFLKRFVDPGPQHSLIDSQVLYRERQKTNSNSGANSRHQRFNSLFSTFVLISLCSSLFAYLDISLI